LGKVNWLGILAQAAPVNVQPNRPLGYRSNEDIVYPEGCSDCRLDEHPVVGDRLDNPGRPVIKSFHTLTRQYSFAG
jgi:hypothetical protein